MLVSGLLGCFCLCDTFSTGYRAGGCCASQPPEFAIFYEVSFCAVRSPFAFTFGGRSSDPEYRINHFHEYTLICESFSQGAV
jgi:hypothetical protein